MDFETKIMTDIPEPPKRKPRKKYPRSEGAKRWARWMTAHPKKADEIAKDLEISHKVYLYSLRCGQNRPGRAMALRIEQYTDGYVRIGDWERFDQ